MITRAIQATTLYFGPRIHVLSWPWPWVVIILLSAVEAAWLLTTPLQLDVSSVPSLIALGSIAAAAILLSARLQGVPRLTILLRGLTFLFVAWPALRLFNHLTMTLPFPLADAWLYRWDQAIGFDWFAYLMWVDAKPFLVQAMAQAYTALSGYSCLLFIILALGHYPERRCAEMIELFVLTALACMTLGMFFPAEAAMAYLAPPPETFAHFNSLTGTYHLSSLGELRANPSHALDIRFLPGLVTFPSFHTAMGVVAIYCARGSVWLFPPMLVVNLLMISSTPVFGSHYAVDVIAGVCITVFVILMHRHVSRSGPSALCMWLRR